MANNQPPGIVNDEQVERYLSNLKGVMENHASILKRALPGKEDKYLSFFINVGYTAIYRQPKLLSCELNSVFHSILLAAQLDLMPNTPLGHSTLVPHWNTKGGFNEAVLYVQYQGHLELMYRNPRVELIEVQAVYQSEIDNNLFSFKLGTNPQIDYTPDLAIDRENETPAIVYLKAYLVGAREPILKIVSAAEILKRRAMSPAYKNYIKQKEKGKTVSCVWVQWESDMMLKTVLLMGRKQIPQSIQMGIAAEHENRQQLEMKPLLLDNKGNVIEGTELNPTVADEAADNTEETQTKSDRLNDKLKKQNGAKKPPPAKKKESTKPPPDMPPKVKRQTDDKQPPAKKKSTGPKMMMNTGQLKGITFLVEKLEGKSYQDQDELAEIMLKAAGLEYTLSEASGVAIKLQARFKKHEADDKDGKAKAAGEQGEMM